MKIIQFLVIAMLFLSACVKNNSTLTNQVDVKKYQSLVPEVLNIKEAFATQRDESNNVDSPAIWFGPNGEIWLLATAKEGNIVIIYNASNGEILSKFGRLGNAEGELSRPNGIAVIDNYAIVVERDNHRVQLFSLPDCKSLGYFGQNELIFPYGLAVDFFEGKYHLYVTDNYETEDEETPPADSLGQRVHYYTFTIENEKLVAIHVNAFGETSGQGVLHTVESILIDREYDRLLISDENELQRNVKIYKLDGSFSGNIIPYNYFFYEPEGIVVWKANDKSGYYIVTDQGKINNTFQVFDRQTLAYIGGFSGQITRNTDGIAITQKAVGSFDNGVFYPVHDDGSVTAINWTDIANGLNLKLSGN